MIVVHSSIWPGFLLAALLLAAGTGTAEAQGAPKTKSTQTATGFPNALQGFQRNRNDPIKIEANALEVRDKDKTAVFTGNVMVQQGDTQQIYIESMSYETTFGHGSPQMTNSLALTTFSPASTRASRPNQ